MNSITYSKNNFNSQASTKQFLNRLSLIQYSIYSHVGFGNTTTAMVVSESRYMVYRNVVAHKSRSCVVLRQTAPHSSYIGIV